MAETSTKPYLVRALYEWCCDNGYTPYLAVSVDADTRVPMQYVKGGEIVLNISPAATNRLTMNNDRIEFQARFSGVAQQLSIPVGNVTAIYARETGHGMAFDVTRIAAGEEGASAPATGASEEDVGGRTGDDRTGDDRTGDDRTPGSGAEVIAFGPDAARRRRRGSGRGRREATEGLAGGPGSAADEASEANAGPGAEQPAAGATDAAHERSAYDGSGDHGAGGHGAGGHSAADHVVGDDRFDDDRLGHDRSAGEHRHKPPDTSSAPAVDGAGEGPGADRAARGHPRELSAVTDREDRGGGIDDGRPPQRRDPMSVVPPADREAEDRAAEPVSADGDPEPRPPASAGAGKGRRSPRLTRVK